MKWISNTTINQEKIEEVSSYIDKDLLINRICFNLNISKKELFKNITEEEIELLISTILINREIDNKDKINSLINDISSSILNPYSIHNAKKAADIITEYCNNSSSYIYIFADYDCDGINSGYIMTSVLSKLSKGKVIVKYPNRNEGYGLNIDWCKSIVNKHTSFEDNELISPVLVITVDNGITKYKEVELLKSNGIEVIITDHHSSKEGEVPNCVVVNPHNYTIPQGTEHHHLCGCSVAFKVAELVQHNFGIDTMINYTPYVAIATLSDVMPMTDENLAFIQYGLEIINSDNCPLGLKALKTFKGIDVVTANDILWTIAPMINACGRMGDSELASKLLFLDNNMSPEDIVIEIDNINEKRKKITKDAQKDLAKLNFDNHKVCILPTNKYPQGIIGIIAGKLAEQFNKPSIVVSQDKKGLYHGSIRSVNGIDMISLLKQMYDLNLIESYGGHSEACVCGFDINNLNQIQDFLDNNIIYEDTKILNSEKVDALNIDEVITINHLNDIVYTLVNLLPCDNRKYKNPTFALTNVIIKSFKPFKSGYTELVIQQGDQLIETSVYGDMAQKLFDEILPNIEHKKDCVHIAGTIDKKSFFSSRFQKKIYTLNVMDIMIA